MDSLSGKILGATEHVNYFFDNIKFNSSPLLLLDIAIVAIIFYWVYIFLKETRAMRILYGLIILLILIALGNLLNLVLLNWILKSLTAILLVAIPVVFQPELRTALEKLGRTKFLGELAFVKHDSNQIVNEIITTVSILSKQKIGALIVIQRQTGLREYIDNGISLDAVVSAELLLSIFFPKSPLHDGAVIIVGDKIVSASSILPVSQTNLSNNLGTRHKAALGITENSDAISVVVSEETGYVSMAVSNKLELRITEERLKNRLLALIGQTKKNR